MKKHDYSTPESVEFVLQTRTSVCLDASIESFTPEEEDEDFNMYNEY